MHSTSLAVQPDFSRPGRSSESKIEAQARDKRREHVSFHNNVSLEDVRRLLPLAQEAIGQLATTEKVLEVAEFNPESVWLIQGKGEFASGFQAWLLFNEAGRDAVFDSAVDPINPELKFLCAPGEKPALLYIWASYAPGRAAFAIPHIIDHFSSPRYSDVDIISWAAGVRGERAMQRLGFSKGITVGGREFGHFWVIRRSPASLKETRPRYDSYLPGARVGGIAVVRSTEDFMKVAAIRAAVYMAEQSCPYDEEFDGNDFASTHQLFYKEDEPAGCMRIRFFGDFAKMERLAVRKEFRTTSGAFELVRAAVELCRAKGIRKLYGHAREDLLPFWKRFGFQLKPGSEPFVFSDHSYVEMVDEIQPSNHAVNIESGPYTLIRPEGRWHEPGILETSATRGVR